MTGATCRQIFRVLRRHLVRRTRNIRSEREIDGAHDGPTIKSKPVPTEAWQNSERFVSFSNISKSQCFKSARATPNRESGLPAVSATVGQNLRDFCRQIACPKPCGG